MSLCDDLFNCPGSPVKWETFIKEVLCEVLTDVNEVLTEVNDNKEVLNAILIEVTDNKEVLNAVLTEVAEIETHLHSYEIWMEKAAVPAGETNIADEIGTVGGLGAFRIDAGNNTWGAWVQILGSADTPVRTGKTVFDFHKIVVEASEKNETYFIQIGLGTSGADALTTECFTEIVLEPLTNQVDSAPIIVQTERRPSGTKAWARCMCPGQNTATIDFYIGFHEYDE